MTEVKKESWKFLLGVIGVFVGILLTVISTLILSKLDYIESGLRDYYTFKFAQVQQNIKINGEVEGLKSLSAENKNRLDKVRDKN